MKIIGLAAALGIVLIIDFGARMMGDSFLLGLWAGALSGFFARVIIDVCDDWSAS